MLRESQGPCYAPGNGATKTVARDDSATNAFINALLNSRDSSRSLTTDDVLPLASFASRALDELD